MSDAVGARMHEQPAARPFTVRLRGWRNALIATQAFQRWSMRLPFVRATAKRKADALYALTAGFVYSQVFATAIETGLLQGLSSGARGTDAMARITGLGADGTARLLSAAESLGLVTQVEAGLWMLDDLGVVAVNDAGILAMVRHHRLLYADLADTASLLRQRSRQTNIAKLWAYSANPEPGAVSPDDARTYSDLMRVSQDAVAREVLASYDFSAHRELVDVGGGHGRFLWHVGNAHPSLALHLFDLPPVAEQGAAILAAEGLGARTRISGGSFFDDPVPAGADCYSLVRVLYDHDDAAALKILTHVRAAMTPGTPLIIAEPMGAARGPQARVNAYFTLYLTAMASGRCRSASELADLARRAGFAAAREVRTAQPLYTGLVVARA
ncbi:MAG: methyltransferase [Rhizobiaceae bacterium]|jgi:demethylspheroidene O-methyltransferase|nr:methyltransferase [Rhizobiaceae bacterium]